MATAVATMMAMMASTTAATTAIATVAAIAAAVMAESHRLAVTADEGDANDREKHRETKNNDTVHPQILQITYRYRKRKLPVLPSTAKQARLPTAQRCARDQCLCGQMRPSVPKRSLLSKSTGYEGCNGRKG
jgi:hypothetical protein